MEQIYRKMYATLAGRIDTTLNFMEECLLHQNCDWKNMNQAAKKLKDALLEAEEMYLDAEDE
ncbi:MAG: hypothetical protein HDT18_04715 [Oscillibacter sp.]|nr:hypothetical protein [Oscillibacter sp.]